MNSVLRYTPVVFILTLALAACQQPGESTGGGTEQTTPTMNTEMTTPDTEAPAEQPATQEAPATEEAPAPADQGGEQPAAPDQTTEANEIQVGLSEFTIDMPKSIKAGPTVFQVKNTGTMPHNIEIEGQGIETELPENLQGGESGTLRVTLKPGQYRVYCPVGNHAQRGMDMQLQVTEQ